MVLKLYFDTVHLYKTLIDENTGATLGSTSVIATHKENLMPSW